MDIKISPRKLTGSINVPPSKSISHRALICAALADGKSTIRNILHCEDIKATANALVSLGAEITFRKNDAIVTGIGVISDTPGTAAEIDCGESGSTLRFLMPVAAVLGRHSFFSGKGKLPQRPLIPYFTEFKKHGIIFISEKMPYEISGRLTPGDFRIAGNISSQFITGLLFALPVLEGDSRIILTSPLESKPYVNITIDCLKCFGIEIEHSSDVYYVKGGQYYKPADFTIEADLSHAAFFAAADCISGKVNMENINHTSIQGDKKILEICENFKKGQKNFDIDAGDIPDIVPVLSVLLCFAGDVSYIRNCARLRIKESDRLTVIADVLNRIGGKIEINGDDLKITPVENFQGGICSAHNDHRIAMSLAIASTRCTKELTITGAECVSKSYPGFWQDFSALGGCCNVISH